MNPRTTLLLALVAAALGAFVYLYEIRGGEQRKEAEEQAKRLFPGIESEAVEAIELRTSDGVEVRLVRTEGAWRLAKPLDFPADEAEVSVIASNLAELASESVIEDAQAPEIYGLGDEGRRVRFEAGGAAHVLRIGANTPVGYNTYAATADADTIYAVPTFKVTSLEKSVEDLRDKRVLRFPRERIDGVHASWPSGEVRLEKREGTWQLMAPIEGPADERTVEDLLSDVSFLRAEAFLDEPPADAEVGLDRPAFRLELKASGAGEAEPQTWTLAIGDPIEGSERVARGGEASLYRIAGARFDELPRKVDAYRFRTLARFVASDAASLELVFHPEAGEPLALRAERADGSWSSAPEPIDPGKAVRLVAELSHLRGEQILADAMGPDERVAAGLSPPRVSIRVLGVPVDEGDEPPVLAEVLLGRFDDAGIVARAADGETVYRLDYALAEHLPVSLEAFRNRFRLTETDPADEAGEAAVPETEALPLELPDLEP